MNSQDAHGLSMNKQNGCSYRQLASMSQGWVYHFPDDPILGKLLHLANVLFAILGKARINDRLGCIQSQKPVYYFISMAHAHSGFSVTGGLWLATL